MNKKSVRARQPLPALYRRCQGQLARLGWVALGTVLERNRPGQGGPRYQWSRRVEGKTITVALSAEQFAWLKAAIANQRQAWNILEKMHRYTLQHMWQNLPGTARRKKLSNKTLGLN
jgi:phosphodiesterase/alkaline phosphatase D-like protein